MMQSLARHSSRLRSSPGPSAALLQRRTYMGRPLLVQKADRFPYPRTGGPAVQKGKVSERLSLPSAVERPPYADFDFAAGQEAPRMAESKFSRHDLHGAEMPLLRRAGAAAAELLEEAKAKVEAGATTDELDRLVHERAVEMGVYPALLNFRGFPKSCYCSVNEVVTQGTPDDRPLESGDVVTVEVAAFVDGYYSFAGATVPIDAVDQRADRLIRTAKQCLDEAVAVCAPGVPLQAVGKAVSEACTRNDFSSCRGMFGRGIGDLLRMQPTVFQYDSGAELHGAMQPGWVFTIEPFVCEGTDQHTFMKDFSGTPEDGGFVLDSTVVTADGGWSAMFRDTVVVTETGVEVLTRCGS